VALFLLLRKLEGLTRENIAYCKGQNKQQDTGDDEEPRLLGDDQSCLLKEADVEAESQRVERLDAEFGAPNEGVLRLITFFKGNIDIFGFALNLESTTDTYFFFSCQFNNWHHK
jgi:hypothetical protein